MPRPPWRDGLNWRCNRPAVAKNIKALPLGRRLATKHFEELGEAVSLGTDARLCWMVERRRWPTSATARFCSLHRALAYWHHRLRVGASWFLRHHARPLLPRLSEVNFRGAKSNSRARIRVLLIVVVVAAGIAALLWWLDRRSSYERVGGNSIRARKNLDRKRPRQPPPQRRASRDAPDAAPNHLAESSPLPQQPTPQTISPRRQHSIHANLVIPVAA